MALDAPTVAQRGERRVTRLVVRLPNWLGDVIMALPALRAVRTRWADVHLAVALPRQFAQLLSVVPGVDSIVPLEARPWRDRAARRADCVALRNGQFDRGILFTNSFASALMMREARIAERIGYAGDWRSRLLSQAVPRPGRRGATRHQSRYYGALVEALGCRVETYGVTLVAPEPWTEQANALLGASGVTRGEPFVAFAPGAAYGTAKQWLPDRIAAVIDACVRRHALRGVLVGAAGDREAGAAVEGHLRRFENGGAGVVNLIGRTDLPALIGLASRCRAFVCNDSGGMHLASAFGATTVATFGATDELATSPLGPHVIVAGSAWCRPCLRRECPIDHRCMTSISPERVLAAILRESA